MLDKDSFDVAVVMILVHGNLGSFQSKAKELIEHVQVVKPNLLIRNTPFVLGYTAFRNVYIGLADLTREVHALRAEMTSVKYEVARVSADVTNISSELKEMKLLLHQVVSVRVALRMVVSLESSQVRQFLVDQKDPHEVLHG